MTCWPEMKGNAKQHVESFKRQTDAFSAFAPDFHNSHSGLDLWPERETMTFWEDVLRFQEDNNLDVGHETHRGRILFNPRETLTSLNKFPGLQLTADFSHWVNVCERVLDDEDMGLETVAPRVRHIHARVGYEQGPQVPDPRAPEYAPQLAAHEHWWAAVWKARAALGQSDFTLTPEFGPPAYQHTLPYTQMPVADPWEISLWMANRQKQRFSQLSM